MSAPAHASLAAGATIAEAQRAIARELGAAGIANAADEARWLIEAALGLRGSDVIGRSGEVLDEAQRALLATFLERRVKHEPLSRILGQREFYGRRFKVTPATLDPRADTETIIEAACEIFAGSRERPLRFLDIGTGTGALLVTLLAEFPNAQGVATDISADALAVARENAEALGVAGRATFVETDLAAGIGGPFDLVVSNPPYIASRDIESLSPAVKDFDPRLALDGGSDGLGIYRRLCEAIPATAPDAIFLLEVGLGQAAAVAQIIETAFSNAGRLASIGFFADVAGIRRVVAARARSWGDAEKGLGFPMRAG